MNKADAYYVDNLRKLLNHGCLDENPRPKYKDGTPAHSKFLTQVFEEYNITQGEFPITTLRNTSIKTGIKEILWIYQSQDSSLITARNKGIFWWEDWNIGDDTIGRRYGATVSKYDLMNNLLEGLKKDPFSRRHVINLYQYQDLMETEGLYPCAYETLFSVRRINGELFLDMSLVQRSNDYIIAGYINKIQYTAFMMMVAGHCGYKVGNFCHLTQNLHIYDRHYAAAEEILNRSSSIESNLESVQPRIELVSNKNFYDYSVGDFLVYDNIGKKLDTFLEIAI
jgi:thymidylate synthase